MNNGERNAASRSGLANQPAKAGDGFAGVTSGAHELADGHVG